MKKRKLGLLLCFCLLLILGLFLFSGAAFAGYDDGLICPGCGHWHWDDHVCAGCDACSDNCRSDCYEDMHPCPECDKCMLEFGSDYFCPDCGKCIDCMDAEEDDGIHCRACHAEDIYCYDCYACYDCAQEFVHCCECDACMLEDGVQCDLEHEASEDWHCWDHTLECERCGKCLYHSPDKYCETCKMCISCAGAEGMHCFDCLECFETVDLCEDSEAEFGNNCCIECCKSGNWHCSECERHVPFGSGGGDGWCPIGGMETHCAECGEDFYCDLCNTCVLCEGIAFCDDCQLCEYCCLANLEAFDCTCEDQCVELLESNNHICIDCDMAFCTHEECEFCDRCVDCCEESNRCEHDVCLDDEEGILEHSCVDCNECFDESELCPDCVNEGEPRCYDDCHALSEESDCDHEVCIYSADWAEHYCDDGGHCIEEYCFVCDGCKTCCDEERNGCEHDFTCPNDSSWDAHFCGECDDCFDEYELCCDCGLCLNCCKAAAQKLGCEHEDTCIGSPDWQNHYCYTHNKCVEFCEHPICEHTTLSDWSSDNSGHWRVCADCGAPLYNFPKQSHSSHAWTVTTPATATEPGERKLLCNTCNWEMKTKAIPKVGEHECVAQGIYSFDDESGHYRTCGICGARMDFTAHNISGHHCTVCSYCDVEAPIILDYSRNPKVNHTDSTSPVYASLYVIAQGEGITYQWYEEAIEEGDGGVLLAGETNARLNFKVQDYFGNDLSTCTGNDKTVSRFICVVQNAADAIPVTIDVNFECLDQYWQDMDAGSNTDNGHILTCRVCNKTEGAIIPHRYNGTYKCADCGHVKPIVIKSQPYNTSVKVQDDALGPVEMKFSVAALGEGLQYQWYYSAYKDSDSDALKNRFLPVADNNTSSVTFNIYSNACLEEPHYDVYCVITDASGNTTQTRTARGEVLHTYVKGYKLQTPTEIIPLYNDTHHWRACIGNAHTLEYDGTDAQYNAFEKTTHNKVQFIVSAASTSKKAVVKDICSVCGWESEEYEIGDVLPECTGTGGTEGTASPDGEHHWAGYYPILPQGATNFVIPSELRSLYGGDVDMSDNTYDVGISLQHASECMYCGMQDLTGKMSGLETGYHDFYDGWHYYRDIVPTEDHGAIMYRYDSCEDFYEAKVVPALPHEHKIGALTNDQTQHWNACTKPGCDAKQNLTAHTYSDWRWITEPTSTVEGLRERNCTVLGCGYIQTQNTGVKTYPILVTNGKADMVSAKEGEIVTITANDSAHGKKFRYWNAISDNVVFEDKKSAVTTFVMPAEVVEIKARFSSSASGPIENDVYSININNALNGSVASDYSMAEPGTVITLVVTANEGYVLDTIKATSNGTALVLKGSDTNYTFTMPSGDVNVHANFKKVGVTSSEKRTLEMQIASQAMTIDGKPFDNDVAPIIMNDRTLVPIRVITEFLGGTVDWNATTKEITLTLDGKVIKMTIGQPLEKYGVAPMIIDNRTYVPIRFVADELGAITTWIPETRTVIVEK